MNYKKQIILLLSVLVVIVFFGVLKLLNIQSEYCMGIIQCFPRLIFSAPYQYFVLPSLAVIPILFIMLFLKENVYLSWRKFALFYIPIAAFFISLSPESSGNGFFTVSLGFTREVAAMTFSGLFLIISLILIGYKSLKLRQKH